MGDGMGGLFGAVVELAAVGMVLNTVKCMSCGKTFKTKTNSSYCPKCSKKTNAISMI